MCKKASKDTERFSVWDKGEGCMWASNGSWLKDCALRSFRALGLIERGPKKACLCFILKSG